MDIKTLIRRLLQALLARRRPAPPTHRWARLRGTSTQWPDTIPAGVEPRARRPRT
jgi:hypothetical protein